MRAARTLERIARELPASDELGLACGLYLAGIKGWGELRVIFDAAAETGDYYDELDQCLGINEGKTLGELLEGTEWAGRLPERFTAMDIWQSQEAADAAWIVIQADHRRYLEHGGDSVNDEFVKKVIERLMTGHDDGAA